MHDRDTTEKHCDTRHLVFEFTHRNPICIASCICICLFVRALFFLRALKGSRPVVLEIDFRSSVLNPSISSLPFGPLGGSPCFRLACFKKTLARASNHHIQSQTPLANSSTRCPIDLEKQAAQNQNQNQNAFIVD